MEQKSINMSKRVKLVKNVKSYFENFQFEEKINLMENLPLSVHWSDSTSLVNSVRLQAKSSEGKVYQQKQFALETIDSLKKVPLWLKQNDYVIPMTMFDIYHSMGQFIKKESLESELYNVYNLSFIGPTGPFKEMPMIDCINDQMLNIYIHWLVMTNKLPQRAFRLLTQGIVQAELHLNGEKEYTTLNVSQITDTGILFRSKDELLLETLSKTEQLKIYLDSFNIQDALNSNHNFAKESDLFYTEDKLKYFIIDSNKVVQSLKYNSHKSGEFYMFCRYHHMLESEIPSKMKKFTKNIKEIFLESVA